METWDGSNESASGYGDWARRLARRKLAVLGLRKLFATLAMFVGLVLAAWLAVMMYTRDSQAGVKIVAEQWPLVLVSVMVMVFAYALLRYLEPSVRRAPTFNGASLTWILRRVDEQVEAAVKTAVKTTLGAAPSTALDDTNRKQLIDALTRRIKEESLGHLTPEIQAAVIEGVEQKFRRHSLDRRFEAMTGRLYRETQDLARRGNPNLVLGMFTTLTGLVVLAYSVFQTPASKDYSELLAYFVPRVSLVLLIELFAYFFLKLYKESLSGIKYFQNELTNVESKQVALEAALDGGTPELRSHIVQALGNTERNFILKKDETTVDLERERLGKDRTLGLVEQLKQIVKGEKGEAK